MKTSYSTVSFLTSCGHTKNLAKHVLIASSLALTSAYAHSDTVPAADYNPQQKIIELEQEIKDLKEFVQDNLDLQNGEGDNTGSHSGNHKWNRFHIGGYGELHYTNLESDNTDVRELDFHRLVVFLGYDFSDTISFVTELEIEHLIASAGNRGAVEVEQAYVEFRFPQSNLKIGAMLMPIGIINETHEPTTFYGVERPIVETTIIPTTWWSTGALFSLQGSQGLQYDIMLSEGLKTEDPNSKVGAEPFNLKKGKQKGSFASAFDLAVTGRIRYRGIRGLELAAYGQYQPDLDQSAKVSYADDAFMLGGHAIYQWQQFTVKALYTRWELSGDAAEAAGKHVQDGGYLEGAWKINDRWGVFARHSAWSLVEDQKAQQTAAGANYYPVEGVVLKASLQVQNDDAGDQNGFYLGMGYAY